jgi:pimeloyl-ACP methyl ester carboxylesterase
MPSNRRRFLRLCAIVAGAFALLLATVYEVRDLERTPLDDAARRQAPGRFVHLADGMTHYEMTGPDTARTIVLLTGMSVPYYLWDRTHDSLVSAGYRVLRYDYYGRGWSDRPDGAYDLAMYDRQLVGLLDSLAISAPIDLAGASMGGVVAADFANRRPSRVRSLMLIDPAFAQMEHAPLALRAPGLGGYLMTVFAPSLAESQSSDFFHPERFPDWVSRYREQMRYQGFRRAILRTMRGDAMRPSADGFQGLRVSEIPILLIWGREDHTVPFARSTAARNAFRAADFHAIDSAGHVPQYERPGVVGPLLVKFLREH